MKKGRLFPVAPDGVMERSYPARWYRVESTGEYRPPRKGEWYISGAIPEGYKTENDLTVKHQIGRLVEVKTEVNLVVVRYIYK